MSDRSNAAHAERRQRSTGSPAGPPRVGRDAGRQQAEPDDHLVLTEFHRDIAHLRGMLRVHFVFIVMDGMILASHLLGL